MSVVAVADGKGLESVDAKTEHLIGSGSYHIDEDIFLWTAGGAYLGIVDLSEMEYDLVAGLGGIAPGDFLPIATLSAELGRKVLVVSIQKTSDTYYLKYWQKSEPAKHPICVPAEYLDPERRIV